jgi:hypothetical protein
MLNIYWDIFRIAIAKALVLLAKKIYDEQKHVDELIEMSERLGDK